MDNEKILNKRWLEIDEYLTVYEYNYRKINKKLQDEIQEIFDKFDIPYSDLNKPISKSDNDRLDRNILEWQEKGILTNYFGFKAKELLNKKKVTYSEMLNLLLNGAYIIQNRNLNKYNMELFESVCENAYNQGIDDIKPKKEYPFRLPILYTLLNIPLLNATIEEYLYALSLTNAEETYKKSLINLQTNKKLNIDNIEFQKLIEKQNNKIININEDKLSGVIVNAVENLTNLSYLQAGIDTNTKQCRFVSDLCHNVTDMCENMDKYIFNINDWNEFERYIGETASTLKLTKIKVFGLIPGINLPPINQHFHWCHSTIVYNLDTDILNEVRDSISIISDKDKEQFERYKKYYDDEIGTLEEFTKMKYNIDSKDRWNYLKNNYQIAKYRYNSIQKGDITPLVDLRTYLKIRNEVYNKLLHVKLTNDMEVKSISKHFIDRVIGSIEQKRNGVEIQEILNTLKSSIDIRKSYNGSHRVYGKNSLLSISETGNLIQISPYKN